MQPATIHNHVCYRCGFNAQEQALETAQRIHTASTEQKGPLYDALGITISYEHTTRTATVRSRPSSPYRRQYVSEGGLEPPRPIKGTSTSS